MTDKRRHIEKWYTRLPGFLHEAERNGFIRDPRQWAVLAHVLDDAGENMAVLKYRLAPVLVHSPEHQVEFYRLYDLWFSGIEQQEITAPATDATPDQIERESVLVPAPPPLVAPTPPTNINQSTGPRWWQWALLFTPLAALLLVAIWYFGALHPITVIVAVLSTGLAIWSTWRWKNRKIEIARQGSSDSGDNFWDFRLPHRRIGFGLEFRRIAARLRERVPGSAYKVNVPKTVRETARRGGFPSVQLQARSEIPSCLMLIDLSNDNNHRASLFDAFYHYLKDWDVPVERYFYRGIPRVLWNDDCPHGIALDTLAANYSHSRIFLLGDAWNLLDARTMRPTALANTFEAWKDRILLTPIPFPQWTARERQLESLFLIAPFTQEGLQVIDRHLNPEEPFDWELQRPDFWSDGAIRFDEAGLPQSLRPYFPDPAMMEWLAALAFYPTLNWSLTIYLGDLLSKKHNRPLLTFDNLRQLSRLHWFYNGFIPEEAREALYSLLDKEAAECIHAHISTLLEAQLKNREDYVSEERNKVYLQILLHKAHAGKASREELRELHRLAKNEQQDFLIARFTRKPKPWDWVLDSDFSFLLPDSQEWRMLPQILKQYISLYIISYRSAVRKLDVFSFPRTENAEPKLESDVQHVEISENKEKSPASPVTPLRIFISYLREDTAFFEELRDQLRPLDEIGRIEVIVTEKTEGFWAEIEEKRRQSDILLFLVSAAGVSKKDYFEKELFLVKEQIDSGQLRIFPVIVNSCNWQNTVLAKYQMCPANLIPITEWSDKVAAWTEVTRSLMSLAPNFNELTINTETTYDSGTHVPIRMFIIYARADAAFKDELLLHLYPFVENKLIEKWVDSDLLPGEDWEKRIQQELEAAHLVIMLVSADALSSEFIRKKELKTAIKKKRAGSARVVPVLVRDCMWELNPDIAELQLLPRGDNGRIQGVAAWLSRDSAWTNVCEELYPLIQEIHAHLEKEKAAIERAHKAEEEARQQQEAAEKAERARRSRDETFWKKISEGAALSDDPQHQIELYESYLREDAFSLHRAEAEEAIDAIQAEIEAAEQKRKEAAELEAVKKYANLSHAFTLWFPEFLPKSHIARFVAHWGGNAKQQLFWENGLLFQTAGCTALVERREEYKIRVDIQQGDTVKRAAAMGRIFQSFLDLEDGQAGFAVSLNAKDFVWWPDAQEAIHIRAWQVKTFPPETSKYTDIQPFMIFKKTITMAKKVFISYSHRDEDAMKELDKFLGPLEREGYIEIWTDRKILPGQKWKDEILNALHSSDLTLLLVSANFLDSDFINDEEITRAFQRRDAEGKHVVPIILNYCLWDITDLKTLQAIPKDGRPIADYPNAAQGWSEVARGVKALLDALQEI